MLQTHVFEWHKRFKEGWEEVEDDPRNGRLSTSMTEVNVEQVKQIVHVDCQLTVEMIAHQLDMKKDSVWKIITDDLDMRKVCAKMVPRVLNDDQKEHCMLLETEPVLLRRVITGAETWIFEYDLETKCQSSQWKSDVSETKESKTVKVRSQSHVDHILRC